MASNQLSKLHKHPIQHTAPAHWHVLVSAVTDLLPTKCFSPPVHAMDGAARGLYGKWPDLETTEEVCNNRGTELPHTHTCVCTLFQPSTAGRAINITWRILWLLICLSIWTLFILFHTGDALSFLLHIRMVCQTHFSNPARPAAAHAVE